MNEPNSLPLFPLPLVACPTEVVPLHIFEPRYRDLMAWCRAEQAEGRSGDFVITLGDGGTPSDVGTVMRLTRVLKEYPDGRLDVLTQGRRRCRLVRVRNEYTYQTAEVAPFEDLHADWEEALANQAFQLHSRLLKVVSGEEPPPESYAGRTLLSFFLVPTAGLGMAERQKVMAMVDENERLRYLIRHLRVLLERIVSVQTALLSIQQGIDVQKATRLGGAN